MSLSDLASLGSFISGVAVLASLVFLFFQMRQMTEQVRQSERNQQALILQGVRNRGVQIQMARTEPSMADATANGFAGSEDISATQFVQIAAYLGAYFVHVEDAFFQHKQGLLTDEALSTVRGGLKGNLSRLGIRQYWEDTLGFYNFPAEFVSFVDDVIAETPIQDVFTAATLFDRWKAGVAAKKANVLQQQ